LSAKTTLRIANSPGTIDSGYRDEIGIIVDNISNEDEFIIEKGDRIAQMVLSKIYKMNFLNISIDIMITRLHLHNSYSYIIVDVILWSLSLLLSSS